MMHYLDKYGFDMVLGVGIVVLFKYFLLCMFSFMLLFLFLQIPYIFYVRAFEILHFQLSFVQQYPAYLGT